MASLNRTTWIWILVGILVPVVALAAYFGSPQVRERVSLWFGGKANVEAGTGRKSLPAKLVLRDNGDFALKLSKEAVASLQLKPTEALLAVSKLPLPPMIGTVNYDNDRMFLVRPRFQGEVADILEVKYSDYPQGPEKKRPLRFGDRVKQGETLATLWCRDLGEKKAALVDAIFSVQLSYDTLNRNIGIFYDAALPLATLKMAERQVQSDINTYRTAERTLKMWKLTDKEIQEVLSEAKNVLDQKQDIKNEAKRLLALKLDIPSDAKAALTPQQTRDAELINKWARVFVKAPTIPDAPDHSLVVIEKNFNRTDMVDPARDTPMFRLADLNRLQIWVHPPEEYLPRLRERLPKNGQGCLKWEIRFQSDPPNTPGQILDVAMVSPSLEPNQHTPMLIGYLDNKDEKYLIGQFVTATILVPPPLDDKKNPIAVEIPTDAINQIRGQNLVFVQDLNAADEFTIRRVSVIQSSKKISLVRMDPTDGEQKMKASELKKGNYPFQKLLPGDRVITRGVVELTEALEDLRSQRKE